MDDNTNYDGIEKTDAVKLVEMQAEITRLRAENERLTKELDETRIHWQNPHPLAGS